MVRRVAPVAVAAGPRGQGRVVDELEGGVAGTGLPEAFDQHQGQVVPGEGAAQQGAPVVALLQAQAFLARGLIHQAAGPHDQVGPMPQPVSFMICAC